MLGSSLVPVLWESSTRKVVFILVNCPACLYCECFFPAAFDCRMCWGSRRPKLYWMGRIPEWNCLPEFSLFYSPGSSELSANGLAVADELQSLNDSYGPK